MLVLLSNITLHDVFVNLPVKTYKLQAWFFATYWLSIQEFTQYYVARSSLYSVLLCQWLSYRPATDADVEQVVGIS